MALRPALDLELLRTLAFIAEEVSRCGQYGECKLAIIEGVCTVLHVPAHRLGRLGHIQIGVASCRQFESRKQKIANLCCQRFGVPEP